VDIQGFSGELSGGLDFCRLHKIVLDLTGGLDFVFKFVYSNTPVYSVIIISITPAHAPVTCNIHSVVIYPLSSSQNH
jgi:hypothetical protein